MVHSIARPTAAAVLVALLATPLSADANSVASFSALYLFGDSVSDTGNNLLGAPLPRFRPTPEFGYYMGRFQGGPAYTDYFADLIGQDASPRGFGTTAAGTNYARGGANSGLFPGQMGPLNAGVFLNATNEAYFYLPSQIDLFLQDVGGVADPAALYGLQIGSNDVLSGQRTAADAPLAAANLFAQVERLASAGAQRFFLGNLGFLGDPTFDAFAFAFNGAFETGVEALIASGLDVTVFDTPAWQATLDPNAFLLGSCLGDVDCALAAVAAASMGTPFRHDYLTFDGIHFNTQILENAGQFAANLFTEGNGAVIPEPGVATLLLVGLTALGARRRNGRSGY